MQLIVEDKLYLRNSCIVCCVDLYLLVFRTKNDSLEKGAEEELAADFRSG